MSKKWGVATTFLTRNSRRGAYSGFN